MEHLNESYLDLDKHSNILSLPIKHRLKTQILKIVDLHHVVNAYKVTLKSFSFISIIYYPWWDTTEECNNIWQGFSGVFISVFKSNKPLKPLIYSFNTIAKGL